MNPFTVLSGRVVVMPVNDIDTDQIIPARYLKSIDKAGMGAHLFADWRYQEDGTPYPDFILNRPESQGAQVLVAGHNFGCGSSREHAPWALTGWGFRAVISTAFADIFRNNSLKNGLLPVVIDPEQHKALVELFTRSPESLLTIDLATQTVSLPDGQSIQFPIDGFSKTCLLNGVDELGYLLGMQARISAYEQSRTEY